MLSNLIIKMVPVYILRCFFFQAEDGIRDLVRSRGLGDVYKRQREGGDIGVPLMVGNDEVSKKAFLHFAGNAARGIAMRNANLPATEIQEILT